ncbi:MAG: hypothetical protein KAJ33_08935, partial [Thermoplasmata archaeon]|nr:hypothetical protein [Thermoplasmata archaeon]
LGDAGQINATITNQGLSFESVNVWLMEDGNPLFSQVINLGSGFSTPVIFNYTPMAAGSFNISIYATPVPGETIVYNNIVWTDIDVIAVPDIWATPLSYDVTIIAGETHSDNLTIGNSGFAALDYVIDTGGRYEEAGTSSVTMADIYDLVSYDSGGDGTNDTFDHIYIEAFSADMDTMDVIVNAWNGIGWVNLYTGLSGGNVVAVDGDFYAEGYTVLEIFIDDWEDNDDIYYDFNYSLKSDGDWLSVIPDTGSLAPSGTFVHTVIMNGSSLAPGFYQANISVQSNDPDEAVILIPVNLTVQPAPHDIAVISLDIDDFVRANEMVSVNVTVSNQGSNDENNVIVEFWVNGILEDTFVIGFISSGSSVLITFDWLPVLEGPNSLMVEALMVPGEINGSNNIQTAIVDVFDPAPILLVDDDGGISSEIWYYDSIIANGYECDVWDTQIDGTPELDFLGLYGIVIWFTGNDFTSSLTLSERGLVSSYLDGGGKLYLSGGLIGYDAFLNGWTTWYEDYLSTLLVNELIFGGQVFNGINLDEIGDGMTL